MPDAPPASAAADSPGSAPLPRRRDPPVIPDYELLRMVGRGSYGDVWLARGVTGVLRAVKIVWRDHFDEPQPYEREFKGLKEFAAISMLESRQLALLHVGRNDAAGFFYYVMEPADDAETGRDIDPVRYVPNTLKEVRARRGRLPAAEVVALGVELSRALAGLHTRGLVHRDIKPSNVILVGGAPKLADIGLVTNASEAMTFVGTEGYVPPEGPGAPAADVYSLGKLLYELATGLDRQDYPRLPPEFGAMPDRKQLLELNEVFLRACEPDARRRHRDANALLDDLLLLQAGRSVRRLRYAERSLARALRAVGLLAIAAAVAGTGAWIAQKRADREMTLREKAEAERDAVRQRATYSANLARAQRALDNDELSRARQLLHEIVPKPGEKDLRGFEWRALWHEAQGDPHTEIRASGPEVVALFVSPDESTLAVLDKSDAVALYDTVTARELTRARGIRRLAGFSGDGAWLIGADAGGATRRWSAKTGEPAAAPGPIMGAPIAVLDGTQAVAISDGATMEMRVWDFAAQRETLRLDLGSQDKTDPWLMYRTAASSDGRTVVYTWRKGSGSAAQFRLTCIQLGPIPRVQHVDVGRALPAALGVDQAGPWVFFDASDEQTKGEVWRSSETGWAKTIETLPRNTKKYIEFGGDGGHRAVIARLRQIAWLARPDTDLITVAARGHKALINDVVVDGRHNQVFSAATDGSVFCWTASAVVAKQFAAWPTLGATAAVFLPDGKSVWVPKDGHTCVRLDIASLAIVAQAGELVYPIGVSDGVLLGVSPVSGVRRLRATTGELINTITGSSAPVRWAIASSDLQQLAMLDHAGNLFAGGDTQPRKQGMQRWYRIVMDPAGNRLWGLVSTTREVVCLSWPQGQELWRTGLPAIASDILCLPGGKQLVLALEDGALELRDAATGSVVLRKDSGSAAPQTLAYLARGNRLLVAGIEGEIHCLDAQGWEPIHSLVLGRDQIPHRMIAALDEKSVVVLMRSGALRVLRAD
jgi:serine/threonine protein kinase/WD40 repeat protein